MTEENKSETITDLDSLDEFLSNQENNQNIIYLSKVPEVCKDFPCVLGIDEAGRGPVLGPMVYGISYCPINEAGTLVSLGCADSKALSEEKREEIFKKICATSKCMGWAIEVISPNTICNSMYRRSKCSLNEVSMNSAIGLIRAAIAAKVNIAHIFVDTVGPPEKYQAYLLSLFPSYEITVAKKADSTYPIVSAASICAKVSRDHMLKVWNFQEDLEVTHEQFGSGYPGDPVTKKFLVHYSDPVFGYPQLVRFSWSTSENALKDTAYEVEWEEIDEKKTPVKNTSITSFFKATQPKKVEKKKHEYFAHRRLQNLTEL